MDLQQILNSMVEKKASDVHMKAGAPPLFRIDGDLAPQGETILTPQELGEVATYLMDEKQQKLFFEEHREVDLGLCGRGLGPLQDQCHVAERPSGNHHEGDSPACSPD